MRWRLEWSLLMPRTMTAKWRVWAVHGVIMAGWSMPGLAAAQTAHPPAPETGSAYDVRAPSYPLAPQSPATVPPPDAPAVDATTRTVHFEDQPWVIAGIGGFGSPVGALGVGVQYGFEEWMAVGAGGGVNGVGPQAAAYLNFRPLRWSGKKVAFALGPQLALATGRYDRFSIDLGMGHGSTDEPATPSHHAHWMQLDLGLEVQSRSGFYMRFSHGVAVMMNPRGCGAVSAVCSSDAVHDDEPLFTTTIAIGRAFGGR